METIHVDFDDSIAMVMLNHGVTNAIDLQLVHELAQVLQSVLDHSNVRALVLTSTNEKFFSIGFDLPRLLKLSRDELTEFYSSFNRVCMQLHGLRKPTIAAIPGHAVAGGCILAICCDWRLIAEGRTLMGLNEIRLAVPVPYPVHCFELLPCCRPPPKGAVPEPYPGRAIRFHLNYKFPGVRATIEEIGKRTP